MDQINIVVTGSELHFNSMNLKDGICLSKSWKPLISSLKECKKPPL
jgi:hypothetical protein